LAPCKSPLGSPTEKKIFMAAILGLACAASIAAFPD
jgi:hypothetical protein